MIDVTVAVPVKDRREQMLRCLDALLAQDHPSFEILVLDNESTDGTGEACLERAEGAPVDVRVVRLPGTVGAIRNRAGELAHGRLLAFTDSDCLPEPGWLSAAAGALDADAGLGAVQGRVLPEFEPEHGWPATISVTAFTGRFESANVVFRRDAFRASEGFDEVIGHYWEDTAAAFALRRAGWRIGWAPDAVVRHDVTYPGFWHHVRRSGRSENLVRVVARYPEIRRELLFARVFVRPRNARFVLLLAALAAAPRRPAALALTLPYLAGFVAEGDAREALSGPKPLAQALVYDAAGLAGLLRGGLRYRRLVL